MRQLDGGWVVDASAKGVAYIGISLKRFNIRAGWPSGFCRNPALNGV